MIKSYSVRLDWSAEDEAYVAMSPEFPGLAGVDADPYAALSELREALEMAIAVQEEDQEPLPEPRMLPEYSGQFRLRIPQSLHARLAEDAERESVSLNSYVLSILARAVGESRAEQLFLNEVRSVMHELRAEAGAAWARPITVSDAANPATFSEPAFATGARIASNVQN